VAENAGSARKGKATEQLIAAMCVLASGGELNALTALVDDEGVDLGLKRRDGTRTLDFQVKSGFEDERATFATRASSSPTCAARRSDLAMTSTCSTSSSTAAVQTWSGVGWCRAANLRPEGFEVRPRGRVMVRFQASAKPGSTDKWRKRRLERDQLVPALVELVRGLDAAGPIVE
jgi:hypothetical protein